MEIKNALLKQLDPYRSKLADKTSDIADRTRASSEGSSTARSQGDRVSLSSSALLHTAAHAAANKAPEIRQEKIDEIKERLSRGEYVVNPHKVAQKLLESDAFLASSLERDDI